MNRLWIALIFQMYVVAVCAQNADSVALKEVVIEGAKVVNKVDGKTIYVTSEQRNSSASAYGLLAKLGLGGIRVDEVMHTITPLDNRGRVEVRVNGVPTDISDLLRVAPSDILSVEYIDSPGLSYGRDVGYVINLKVREPLSGYTAGAQLTNAVTSIVGDNSVYASANHGNSEFGVDYEMTYKRFGDERQEETSNYLMPDNSVMTVRRIGTDGLSASASHNVGLTYSLRLDSVMAMQLRLKAEFSRSPHDDSKSMVYGLENVFENVYAVSSHSAKPTANMYIETRIGKKSRFTVNAVASLDNSRQWHSYDEGSTYIYNMYGRDYRFDGESMFETSFRPFTMTLGLLYSQQYDAVDYDGDVTANDCSRVSDVYAFGQLKGRLWRISYVGGLGISSYYFRRNDSAHRFLLFRPKLTLQLPLARNLKLHYDFEQSEYMSQAANTGSALIRTNSMEAEAGNPTLRPYRRIENLLRLSYDGTRISASVDGVIRLNKDCNMPQYTRETGEDGKPLFVVTQRNNGDCRMLYASSDVSVDIIPNKFVCSVNGGVYRFINIGADYKHYYTAFNGSLTLVAYWRNFTFYAYADNGWNFMEGETKNHLGKAIYIAASYKLGNFTFLASWQHPFSNKVTSVSTELLNAIMSKESSVSSGNIGNMFSFAVSWTIEKGRKYRTINR